MAVLAKLRQVRLAKRAQSLAKRRTALGAAERIDLHLKLEPQLAAQFIDHDQQFGVASGVGAPQDLNAKLRDLAEAPLLRPLPPKHRAGIVEALLWIAPVHPGFDIGADHAR